MRAPLKLLLYRRYADDTVLFWQHDQEDLYKFVDHINSICESIQFTKEQEYWLSWTFEHLDMLMVHFGGLYTGSLQTSTCIMTATILPKTEV